MRFDVITDKLLTLKCTERKDALANGQISVIPRLKDLQEAMILEDEKTEENLFVKSEFLNDLPFIDQCNVCYDDEAQGFILALNMLCALVAHEICSLQQFEIRHFFLFDVVRFRLT